MITHPSVGESDDRFVLDCANGPAIDGHAKVDDGSFAATGRETVDLPRFDHHRVTWSGDSEMPNTAARVYPRAIDELGGEHPIRE